jgi:hypothetical protein
LQVTQKGLGSGGGDGTRGAGKDGVLDVLVMENIFYGHATSRIYDLKARPRTAAWRPPSDAEQARFHPGTCSACLDPKPGHHCLRLHFRVPSGRDTARTTRASRARC